MQKLLRKARKGTRIVYVPGNHDEFLRDYYGTHFGGIEVRRDAPSTRPPTAGAFWSSTATIRRRGHACALARLSRRPGLRHGARRQPLCSTRLRRRLGFAYWSLSHWAKLKVKNAVSFIGEFEEALADRGAAASASTASSAAISTTPRSATIGDCATSIAATGWRAAPRCRAPDGRLEIIDWTERCAAWGGWSPRRAPPEFAAYGSFRNVCF